MAHPEGSIAEGYIAKDCMVFCSRYLNDTKTKFNEPERNYDGGFHNSEGEMSIFSQCGRPLGAGFNRILDDDEVEKAHIYILKNCDEIQPFFKEYSQEQSNNTQSTNDDGWNVNFIRWLRNKAENLQIHDQSAKSDELLSLARGPAKYVKCFNGYVNNGYRSRIEACDKSSKTQNSGVCVIGDIGSGPDYVDYYGVLTEIIEVQYLGGNRVVLFKCRWFDVYDNEKGIKVDEHGFTSVNSCRFLKVNEPFILATQAFQVFYVIDNMNKGWCVVLKTKPRDLYEMAQPIDDVDNNEDEVGEAYQHDESFKFECNHATTSDNWKRTDLDPMIVDIPTTKKKRKHKIKSMHTKEVRALPKETLLLIFINNNIYTNSARSFNQELLLPIRKKSSGYSRLFYPGSSYFLMVDAF